MNVRSELIKAIYAKWDIDGVPLYHLSAPQDDDVDYPLATFKIISSPTFYSMSGDGGKANVYHTPVVQFNVFLNQSQMALGTGYEYMDQIDALYHQGELTLGSGRWMCSQMQDWVITYYEDGEKIYRCTQTYKMWVGE